jgi:DNA-binding NarL/FixJ family response regulator
VPTPARDRGGRWHYAAPTERQIVVLLAVIRRTTYAEAAKSLGITLGTVKSSMSNLIQRIGARDQANAVWMLYPRIRRRIILPGWQERRRRLGPRRRR